MGTKQTPDFIDGNVDQSNRVNAQWLNGVNTAVYEVLGNGSQNPTTAAQARTNMAAAISGNNDDITSMQLFTAYGIDMAADSSINYSMSTLASTTQPDIWSTQSNVIAYTGSIVAVSFASAPQVGATRTLICAANAGFLSGANLIIPGIPAGVIFTAQNNMRLEVVALTESISLLTIAATTQQSWIPEIQGAGGGGPLLYEYQVGDWSFRDGIVEYWGNVHVIGGVVITGSTSIEGLPIAAAAKANMAYPASLSYWGNITLPGGFTAMGAGLVPSSSSLYLYTSGSGNIPILVDGSLIGNGFYFAFSGRYKI